MKRSILTAVALMLLTTTSHVTAASAGRMTFEYKAGNSNARGSDWIAAEGEIVDDSADDFEKFLKGGSSWEGVEVRLHSHGGSLIGGIKLGEFFRKHKVSTTVGGTVGEHPIYARADGVCVSACAIAFIGGVERAAEAKSLGIHQFYRQASLRNPSEKIFNGLDMSGQQMVSALLIDYAFRMGEPPRVCRRLQLLRGRSHGQAAKTEVFA